MILENSFGRYSQDSTEMQLRRLADLSFMFQLYDQAYHVYYSLKRDFYTDKSLMFCAGSQVGFISYLFDSVHFSSD